MFHSACHELKDSGLSVCLILRKGTASKWHVLGIGWKHFSQFEWQKEKSASCLAQNCSLIHMFVMYRHRKLFPGNLMDSHARKTWSVYNWNMSKMSPNVTSQKVLLGILSRHVYVSHTVSSRCRSSSKCFLIGMHFGFWIESQVSWFPIQMKNFPSQPVSRVAAVVWRTSWKRWAICTENSRSLIIVGTSLLLFSCRTIDQWSGVL